MHKLIPIKVGLAVHFPFEFLTKLKVIVRYNMFHFIGFIGFAGY